MVVRHRSPVTFANGYKQVLICSPSVQSKGRNQKLLFCTIFEPHILENEEIESEPEVSILNESVLSSPLEPGEDEKEEETVTNSNACRENISSVPSSQHRIKMLNTLLTVITFLCLIYQVLCWLLTVSSVEKLHFILSPLSMFLESCGIKTQQSGKQT